MFDLAWVSMLEKVVEKIDLVFEHIVVYVHDFYIIEIEGGVHASLL